MWYYLIGDIMKVKIFDDDHELDLEEDVNNFIKDKEVVDIKYNVAVEAIGEEQIYCYSAMIIYINRS